MKTVGSPLCTFCNAEVRDLILELSSHVSVRHKMYFVFIRVFHLFLVYKDGTRELLF